MVEESSKNIPMKIALLESLNILCSMLSPKIKKLALFLYFLVLVASVLEFLIIISIAPLVASLTSRGSNEIEQIRLLFVRSFGSTPQHFT